jgi:hypothetical protein
LPSLVDVFTVIVLVLPGFVSFVLFNWISIVERKFSDFEKIVGSLFMSLLIYAVFSFITGINNINTIRDLIFLPNNLAIILLLSLILGVTPGIITRYAFRQQVVRGDCWDVCMNRAIKNKNFWVLVYTELGSEYKGRLHLFGTEGEHKHEIVLEKPKLIIRNEEGKVDKEFQIGSELLFLQKDVRRIVFLDTVRQNKSD